MTTKIPYGDPGIASFASQEYGSQELFSGDTKVTTTTEAVGESTTLAAFSVVGRNSSGNLALATFGGEGAKATGTLTFSGVGTADDTITIGSKTYTLKAAPTTVANEVLIGASATATAANLIAAINGAAGAGTAYGSLTTAHPDVIASAGAAGVVEIQAKVAGQAGDAIATTETGSNTSFGSATLTGGIGANVMPIGITTAAVTTGSGVTTTVDVYRSGMFNPDALTWDASFNSDAKKKAAFEGSISPNIFIQKIANQYTFS
jgi:hypothetical protein